jgi:hypothetical protein
LSVKPPTGSRVIVALTQSGDWFETNVTDQLAFLTYRVPVND